MWRLLVILALGLSAAFQVGGPDGSIEDFIDTEMPASGVPGLAYAVVADGDVTSVGARGVVKIGGGRKVTSDTAFLTGSISKSFTALAVMQLVEQHLRMAVVGMRSAQCIDLGAMGFESEFGQSAVFAQTTTAIVAPAFGFGHGQRVRPIAGAIAEQQFNQARVPESKVVIAQRRRWCGPN